MMPPVSLPLNGGTVSAHAGLNASIPPIAARAKALRPKALRPEALMTPASMIRIANSISLSRTIKRLGGHEKNAAPLSVHPGAEWRESVAALHLTLPGLRGTVRARNSRKIPLGGLPMRDLFSSVKKPAFGAALGIVLGLFAYGPAAEAANPFEMNFWLSGPKYDGRVAPCEAALPTIT